MIKEQMNKLLKSSSNNEDKLKKTLKSNETNESLFKLP